MSKEEKLIQRLLKRPKDFTYNELKKVLVHFGYIENRVDKTSGSRVAFINNETKHIIRLHKPHPNNELKQYQIDQIIEELDLRRFV
ncbi:MAG TPA: type II toxin-antitoxin system HicA family toxin [Spirochaetales bacterium]|nr:type II toxin-antitoxin system HicA family toxin [Spirochaetales bacterium]